MASELPSGRKLEIKKFRTGLPKKSLTRTPRLISVATSKGGWATTMTAKTAGRWSGWKKNSTTKWLNTWARRRSSHEDYRDCRGSSLRKGWTSRMESIPWSGYSAGQILRWRSVCFGRALPALRDDIIFYLFISHQYVTDIFKLSDKHLKFALGWGETNSSPDQFPQLDNEIFVVVTEVHLNKNMREDNQHPRILWSPIFCKHCFSHRKVNQRINFRFAFL